MLRKLAILCIVIFLITMVSVAFVGCTNKELMAESIITIEADAHIEMMVDKNSRVINTNAINNQGEVLLVGENFEGESYSSAVKKIIQLAINTGYINNLMRVVSIDTISIDKEVELKINRQLFNVIKSVDKNLEVKAFNYILEERDYKSFIRNNKGFENFSFLQYRLISNIIRYDSSLIIKQGARLTVTELTNKLLVHYTAFSKYHTYDMYSRMSSQGKLYKIDKGIKMADLIGGQTQQAIVLYSNVNMALLEILTARQKEQVPDKLAESILMLLDLSQEETSQAVSAMKYNEYGYIIGDGLDKIIDKIYLQKVFPTETIQEIFDIKIDKVKQFYNWKSKPLTEKEKQKIYDLLPSGIYQRFYNSIDNIEEAYLLIKMLIEDLTSKYNEELQFLSQEVRAQVQVMVDEIDNADQYLLDKNKIAVDNEYVKLSAEKNKRLDNYKK